MKIEQYQEIVQKIYPKLMSLANRLTRFGDESEDLVQETLIRFWLARERWAEYDNPEAIAKTTMKNIFIDQQRKKKLKYEEIEEQNMVFQVVDIHDKIQAKEMWQHLITIIRQLPPLQKLIFQLKDIEGYEIEEITGITQSSPESVRMNLSRARKRVRELYQQLQ